MLKPLIASAFALMLIAAPGVALAQSAQCRLPAQIERPKIEGPTAKEPKRVLPIGSYTLAISWSPQYCSTGPEQASLQCSGRSGKFGFTLHGLWPDGYGKEWPQYCRAADLVPREVIRQNLCNTPSVQLIQHEWSKHGTCMATKPELYFNLSRAFYQSLRYPDMAALARRKTLTVGQFADAFARANKGLKAEMMRVTTTRGNWLSEVWLCMDRALEFTRCPGHQGGAPDSAYLRIKPGPNIPNPRRSPAAPVPVRQPGLLLDLDPNAQPLTGSGNP
ncbi:ribonuclease T2 [Sphingobium sp. BYY-5]|uniref:ribonuclease T2 n=1 Tax=Sphingobium sp. BYY-5 TaxID=2926400 RepID=UPI001FA7890D|nr:ribonuclease T2 [Sphingobium sp. BYY-5]MCI4588505.1 ribonuclease T2 [Sphingobium sp. BYY-5]